MKIRIGVTIAILIAMTGVAVGNPDPCPAPNAWNSMATSSDVLVLQEDLGGNLTRYYAKSTTDQSPVSGIPGFREVCVLSDATADPVKAEWNILGEEWGAGVTNKGVVEFNGHQTGATSGAAGNPYNIPFDGSAHAAGTVQWDAVPTNVITMVHIISADICPQSADNDNDGDPNTCFRRPPVPPGMVPELSTLLLTATGMIGLIALRKFK